MTYITELTKAIQLLKNARKEAVKQQKLSEQTRDAYSDQNVSLKRQQKLSADLSWQCMEVDKRLTDFARFYDKSSIKTGTDEKEYRPSGFHTYKY